SDSIPPKARVERPNPQEPKPNTLSLAGLPVQSTTPGVVSGASAGAEETQDLVAALPNLWLSEALAQEPIRHDWLTCLIYGRLAQKFRNSREGNFGASACWSIALTETKDISDPSFKGIFRTQKGGLGFLNGGYMARFNKGVAFIGTHESALEGI